MNRAVSLKSFLSKLNFSLGRKPKLLSYPKEEVNKFIPSPHKAVFIISCDFELAWAWRFSKQLNCDLEKAKEIARQERKNIPIILELCERFNIPITWAIVGHLFLDSCKKDGAIAHKDIPRLGHFKNKYWEFSLSDWFNGDPCCEWQNAPEWYAPDLIQRIKDSKTEYEIACHTFSHIDCREEVCPEELLRKEIQECKRIASAFGFELKSFVFPGDFIGNLQILKEEGFLSYRIDEDALGFPIRDEYGLWQIPTTAEIGLSSYGWAADYYIKKYKAIIEKAIKYQRLCHFWFHPCTNKDFLENTLTNLFKTINIYRNELYITTMGGYIRFLENGKY
jgi:peptidoglycan/xylan/chitin deacetylase (PgdA/CDA1 family)